MMEAIKIQSQEINTAEAISHVKEIIIKQVRSSASQRDQGNRQPEEVMLDYEGLKKVAESIESFFRELQVDLKIQIHEGTGRTIFKIISKDDGKVVREIPPEEFLNIAAKVEEMVGVLFNGDV